jgi:L-ascorbate metabolism protein UlaG (beta-lactamase superfamily)
MNRLIVAAVAAFLGLALSVPAAAAGTKVQWFGQSFFLVTSPRGEKIAIDPFSAMGYPMPQVSADIVLITHEHFDHNNYQLIGGNPRVFHGLGTSGWNHIEEQFSDVHIYSVESYHDADQGKKNGQNTIMVLEMPEMRIVHLGDLGDKLTPEQIKKIGRVDVLLIPVGGNFTIDAAKANQVVAQLKPSLIFPMHYKTSVINVPIEPIDKFLAGKTNVKMVNGNQFEITSLPKSQEIIVLDWK